MAKITHLKDLHPDPQNARAHNPRNVGMIVDALQEVGAARSGVIDEEGRILAGNATWEALAEAGIERVRVVEADGNEWVVVRRAGLTEEQKKRLALYDNRTAELAEWDAEVLAGILADDGAVLDGLFYDDELVELLGDLLEDETPEDPGPQVDRAAELQEKWGTATGQIWQLGKHRLLIDDSTSIDNLRRLGVSFDMPLFTDPPYGINRDPNWLDGVYPHRQALSSRDIVPNDDGSLDLSILWEFDRRMVWGFPYIYDPLATGWVVWDKQPGVERRGIVTPIEMASTTMRKGFDIVRVMWGGYYREEGEDKQPHPTQKPIGVYEPFIEQWTDEGEHICDPFCGSGVAFVVAERQNRICLGADIDPRYAAVTIQRMAGLGLEPRLVSDQT